MLKTIGVPKEVKTEEYRVGLTPGSVGEVIGLGCDVLIEKNAGAAIGFTDDMYVNAGAKIVATAADVYQNADMVVKVKEPQPSEYPLLHKDLILFTYLHLAPDLVQTEALMDSGVTAVAYETVTGMYGGLPLLTPMSQVAGRLSIQAGAHCLEKPHGGRGILLGGVPGVKPGKVVVIGGGVVGTNAARMAMGKEAEVVVLDKSLKRLQELDLQFGKQLRTIYATQANIEEQISNADLVVGAVLIPGKAAPKLISKDMLKGMTPGSVLVDVAIDQGGCFETSHSTTHAEPTYEVDGVIHYCVANMPGAVPKTATMALNNATLPFVLDLVSKGFQRAVAEDSHLKNGLNVYKGHITCEGVARDLAKPYVAYEELV